MAFCIQCGNPIKENFAYCELCGTRIDGRTGTRKERYDGVVHKCPNCGNNIGSYESFCSVCGYEFRDNELSEAVRAFMTSLNRVEEVERSNNASLVDIYRRKAEYIRSFVMPNNKEDVFEFFFLSNSNVDPVIIAKTKPAKYEDEEVFQAKRDLHMAWFAKFEQSFQKATMMFSSSTEYKQLEQAYYDKKQEIEMERKPKKVRDIKSGIDTITEGYRKRSKIGKIGTVILVLIILSTLSSIVTRITGGYRYTMPGSYRQYLTDNLDMIENQRLEGIVSEIETDIENEDYKSARVKVNKLYYNGASDQLRKQWDERRESYVELLGELER